MIRSSKTSLKFTNKNKLEKIHQIIDEYKRVMSLFVDILWKMEKVPTLLPKEITSQIETWLSKRMVQCCGKQSSGIVRGTRKKNQQRLFIIKKLIEEKQFKKSRKLQLIYDQNISQKPTINNKHASRCQNTNQGTAGLCQKSNFGKRFGL